MQGMYFHDAVDSVSFFSKQAIKHFIAETKTVKFAGNVLEKPDR